MIMVQTGPVVTLHVAKHAASCHGLEALINQPGSAPNAGIIHRLEYIQYHGQRRQCDVHTAHLVCQCLLLGGSFFGSLIFNQLLRHQGDRGLGTPDHPSRVGASVPDLRPEQQDPGGSRSRRQQSLQRNRLLYRSNPNMSGRWTSSHARPSHCNIHVCTRVT